MMIITNTLEQTISLPTMSALELYERELTLAEEPTTPPTELERLATHMSPLIRRAVAQNPNTPLLILCSLSAAHPREVLQNPAMPLFLLEDPNLLLRFPEKGLLAMLRARTLSRDQLVFLTGHSSTRVRAGVALSSKLPLEAQRAIVQNESIAAALLENPQAPTRLLYFLMGHSDSSIRARAVSHPNAPKSLLAIFHFLGVDVRQTWQHSSVGALRGMLSSREEELLSQCGPFGVELLRERAAISGPTLVRAQRRRAQSYSPIGRGRKGTQFGYWGSLTNCAKRAA